MTQMISALDTLARVKVAKEGRSFASTRVVYNPRGEIDYRPSHTQFLRARAFLLITLLDKIQILFLHIF